MHKLKPALLLIVVVLIALLYHFAFVPVFSELKTSDTKATFNAENSKLNIPEQLGLKTNLSSKSCYFSKKTITSTESVCFYSADYGATRVNPTLYGNHTHAILTSLNQDGWLVDNPTEYRYSQDKLSNVAYHKNIGSVSCNLKFSADSNIIYVNEYSCSRAVTVPDINFSTKIYGP